MITTTKDKRLLLLEWNGEMEEKMKENKVLASSFPEKRRGEKHRSSSKFTLQGWVGGFSGKQTSSTVKSGNSHAKYGVQHSKAGDFSVNRKGSVANATPVSNDKEKHVHYLDKRVVSQDNDCRSPTLRATTNCDNKPGVVEEPPQKDNNNFQKIKWGELDDEALELHLRKSIGDEIMFGDIRNDDLISSSSSSAEGKVNNLVVSSVEADHSTHQSLSLVSSDEEKFKEVNEVTSEDVKVEITNEKIINSSSHISNVGETCHEQVNLVSNEVDEVMVELPAPESEISEVPVIERVSYTVAIPQQIDSFTPEKRGPEKQGESMAAAFIDDTSHLQVDRIVDDVSNVRISSETDGSDVGESKERFRQRLWCFLFENLNRAVDELYLLCELECDVEQMKEAILVLEEAASDFKELQSRVEEFEDVRRSTSQSIDGLPIMKSDHRRPHALSWEVRRMTTSPHRAEILSSSLEAFRKIQQERASMRAASGGEKLGRDCPGSPRIADDNPKKYAGRSDETPNPKETVPKTRKQSGVSDPIRGSISGERRNSDPNRPSRKLSSQNSHLMLQNPSISGSNASGKSKREQQIGSTSETEKLLPRKDKMSAESTVEKSQKSVDQTKKQTLLSERDKERRNGSSWKSMDAWKEKRNWEDILSSRYSYSPGVSRRSADRARTLHDKLMSPEKKKKNALDLKKDAEEKHARAMRIRSELENERVQKLQRNSEKLNRVNEWQAVRSIKLREGMYARHQRSECRHEAFLAQVARRAGDESSKVNEVRFITSLNEENKKLILRQKLHDSELRRAEKLQVIKTKQKEDMAREEAVLERKKVIEAEKLQRLAETQRKKEEAQVRREEERKASSVAREAKAIEQMRKKEVRAKAQQEEAELLAQKLAERLSESEQRRKFYLEQIRERASMDIRDQSSPLLRRSLNKEGLGRSTPTSSGGVGEECHANNVTDSGGSTLQTANGTLQQSLKRRIKRIRQRLMALKYEFPEPPVGVENAGIAYRTAVGTAKAKIGRWLQELQRLRQARKEGAPSIGLITADMVKFLDGKDPELQAARQVGLLDFIASALPASHTSKPEAYQVTIYLLRLLRVVLSVPANRSYFVAQNLLPPIIPMLAAALENYIKIAASSNVYGSSNLVLSKSSIENLESVSEALDGFLWTVATIIGHGSSDECQLQMQDGLQELVIAYQVIHRLRDLFALYDRPQVEGSPFPSSILLGINLLAVLTSRSRTTSSIDYKSFPIQAIAENETSNAKLAEAADFGYSSVTNPSGDNRPQPSALHGSIVLPLPDLPEDRPLDEPFTMKISKELVLDGKHSGKLEGVSSDKNCSDTRDESQQVLIDNTSNSSASKKDEKNILDDGAGKKVEYNLGFKPPVAFLISVIAETGLVCLPSLLTAVLLQANNRLSSEQASHVLPSNFEEVATGVLKVLNNLALIDITFMQRMLVSYFRILATMFSFYSTKCLFLWSVCFCWNLYYCLVILPCSTLEINLSLGGERALPSFTRFVCDLPFVFFSDPELMPILAGTLVAACFGCEQNKGVVQQELSTDMLISLLRSCRNGLPNNPPTESPSECNHLGSESRKLLVQGEMPLRSSRYNVKSTLISSGKGGSASGISFRTTKMRNQKDSRALKLSEEMSVKKSQSPSETSSTSMLHSRFSGSFIDRAEQFFVAETTE
ncbi:hypothetical protein RHGRI_024078 [Rhododendron griersonianum]|uniref:S phase cyclin A-associated protein in the endoplasmic reticulum N-terminal domain-containing protein n=1 Tax=Rhododendron griersonianum TaxID=479676 RepID=A0AAV6JB88_9ERIC|nr:hypothetical protein RHGRI_024078 [Rhododendron griersonianum]